MRSMSIMPKAAINSGKPVMKMVKNRGLMMEPNNPSFSNTTRITGSLGGLAGILVGFNKKYSRFGISTNTGIISDNG